MALVTVDRLKQLFRYDPDTGLFFRLVSIGAAGVGEVRPKKNSGGYFRIVIDGRSYVAHRLAWLYVHGSFPPDLLDHKDGVKTNNRINNLRPCTYMGNVQNVSGAARCKSGLRGAYLHVSGRWASKIRHENKNIELGYFDSAELAHSAYLEAKRKYHTFNPEFTR